MFFFCFDLWKIIFSQTLTHIIIIIIIIIIIFFLTPLFADGLSLESEGQQVSSCLYDSFQYSGQPQQCCGQKGHDSSDDSKFLQSPFQVSGDRSKCVNPLGITLASFSTIFFVLWQDVCTCLYLIFSFSFIFTRWSNGTTKWTMWQFFSYFLVFFLFFVLFFFILTRSFLLAGIKGNPSVSQNPKEFYSSHSLGVWSKLKLLHNSLLTTFYTYSWGCPRGVMVKAMNCGIVVREFVLQSRYYVHFRANTLGKGMNPLILPPAMGK